MARAPQRNCDTALLETLERSLEQALRSDYSRFIDGESYAERTWALAALSSAGRADDAYAAELARRTNYLTQESLSQVLVALHRGGETSGRTVDALVNEIWNSLVIRLYQGREVYGGLQSRASARNALILPSETRTLSEMTRALVPADGDDPRIQLLVNALVTLGRGDGWGSTNANAAALLALADVVKPPFDGVTPLRVRAELGTERVTMRTGSDAPVAFLQRANPAAGRIVLRRDDVRRCRLRTVGRSASENRADGRMRRRAVRVGAGAVLLVVLSILGLALSRSGLESPGASHLLLDREGRFLGEVAAPGANDFGYWPLEELPPRVVAATLALEDRRFWSHPGVDPIAMVRALWQNFRNRRRISGASTIAMQVARLQDPGPRTHGRKLVESATALFLTLRHGRQGVLSHYLRIVPYGNRIHGIAYAARCYLGKPVADLSWAEIAFLTAIPQSPARMNPYTSEGREAAKARGKRILDALLEQGELTEDEHQLATGQLARLSFPVRGRRPEAAMHALLRLSERVRTDASVRIVETTLDLDLQEELTRTAWSFLLDWESEGASNAAVIVVDVKTAEVLAWMGSTDYFDEVQSGAIDYTGIDRSSGSTLKPFLYGLALEKGLLTPASVLDDLPRGSAAITNADKSYLGPLLPRAALANSRNIPAVEVLEKVGIDEAFDLLRASELHDGRLPARHYGLGLAIGALPVSLEHLVSAYTVLASDGRYRELTWYRGQPTAPPRQVLSEAAARQVTLFLSDPMVRLSTFPRMGFNEYPFPVAVKTGTSSNYRDPWTVAYSTKFLVGVWVGRADYRPMSRMTGYGAASQLAHKVLLELHRGDDRLSNVPFPPPRGTRPVRLCALTGKRATDACDRVSSEWLAPGQEPADFCGAHVRVGIDIRDGSIATAETPRELIEPRTFVDLPASYADWVARTGLPRPPHFGPAQPGRSREARLSIASPEDGLRLFTDPETPQAMTTLALRAIVDPAPEQVVWYVDGKPFQVVDYPFTARWPLTLGEHRFQVRLLHTEIVSNEVRVWVQ